MKKSAIEKMFQVRTRLVNYEYNSAINFKWLRHRTTLHLTALTLFYTIIHITLHTFYHCSAEVHRTY